MFRHMVFGADDPEAARVFYDATFAAIGVGPGVPDPNGRFIYRHEGQMLIIGRPIDGQKATHANGGTLGFFAPSAEAVHAWQTAGLTNGGSLCEGAPKERISPATGQMVTVAYLRDPTGNKLCVVYEHEQA
ncbi:VOC family protein [Aurantiacibacter xanthus]|uniref:VOC family protein n=1 Tax=Aurantiacibacter xanthus TaxID=1784712 RepID=A0A3A1P1K1_9SPHN|nr:VOC family protein [Aurantiacibacter xanthus]RIV83026.1 VOC family protein [Aurantiacibacter xanthus]